jgi:hypothetical protein
MAFGIDFGTTNSSVAWADASGLVHSLSVRSGKEPFDAVVRSVVLDPSEKFGEAVVGHRAFEAALQRQEAKLLDSFKFKLDKQRLRRTIVQVEMVTTGEYDFAEEAAKVVERRTRRDLYDEHSREEVVDATAQVLRRLLMSDEISREPTVQATTAPRGVLRRLVRSLSKGQEPALLAQRTVDFSPQEGETLYVGIPVTVGPTARKRMLSALAKTGLFGDAPGSYSNVLRRCRFVYEPLAIASTLQLLDEAQTVLIFDYGGGSLDLALLDVSFDDAGMNVRERALGGVPLAGDHLDGLFRETLVGTDADLRQAYERELGSGSEFDRWRAGNYFTFAKIELSRTDSTVLRMPGFAREVTQSEFNRSIEPALSDLMYAVDDCLRRGSVDVSKVGHVILTGGSSLIPAVQARLRERFAHLEDHAYVAGRAGDPISEREALTGVSRGLANYGFMSQFFDAMSPCDFGLWTKQGLLPCLERGEAAVYKLSEAPARRLPVSKSGLLSFALYSDLVRVAFCGAVADVRLPDGVEAVDIRVAASRRRFVPAFAVYAAGTRKLLAKFDLEGLGAQKLERFIESDCEWLPEADHLISAFLTRPLQIGDYVEWRANGGHRRGQVTKIRDVNNAMQVEHMLTLDPDVYRVDVAVEDSSGVVHLGRRAQCDWKIGDVRLV